MSAPELWTAVQRHCFPSRQLPRLLALLLLLRHVPAAARLRLLPRQQHLHCPGRLLRGGQHVSRPVRHCAHVPGMSQAPRLSLGRGNLLGTCSRPAAPDFVPDSVRIRCGLVCGRHFSDPGSCCSRSGHLSGAPVLSAHPRPTCQLARRAVKRCSFLTAFAVFFHYSFPQLPVLALGLPILKNLSASRSAKTPSPTI